MRKSLYFCLTSLHLSLANNTDGSVNADWLDITTWISRNGGYVDPSIRADMTSHSGMSVRGIVSGKALETGRPLLNVPKKLWLSLDKFPEIEGIPLKHTPQCDLNESYLRIVKIAGALALERKKGNTSFYHAYIKSLPSLDDFRSFHPRFMQADVREDFAGLPITAIAADLQLFDARLRECFRSWSNVRNSPVAGISVDEFELAQNQYRTRAFGTGGATIGSNPSMIPGADLLNTDRNLNTYWQVEKNSFFLDTGGVESGSELYDEYCANCENNVMMSVWGLYLEKNDKPLKGSADCNARFNLNQTVAHRHGKFKSLREASEAMLDLNDVNAAKEAGRNAPRCRKELLSLEQGPLRCSFARLAFEHCKLDWGYLGSRVPELALVDDSQFDASVMADLISRSYIRAMHPALLSTSRSFHKNLRKSKRDLIVSY